MPQHINCGGMDKLLPDQIDKTANESKSEQKLFSQDFIKELINHL